MSDSVSQETLHSSVVEPRASLTSNCLLQSCVEIAQRVFKASVSDTWITTSSSAASICSTPRLRFFAYVSRVEGSAAPHGAVTLRARGDSSQFSPAIKYASLRPRPDTANQTHYTHHLTRDYCCTELSRDALKFTYVRIYRRQSTEEGAEAVECKRRKVRLRALGEPLTRSRHIAKQKPRVCPFFVYTSPCGVPLLKRQSTHLEYLDSPGSPYTAKSVQTAGNSLQRRRLAYEQFTLDLTKE